MPEKKTKVKLGLKNLATLPSYFDYTFVHLTQKILLRSELSPKFLLTLNPNPARTRTRPENPGPTYNSVPTYFCIEQQHYLRVAKTFKIEKFHVAYKHVHSKFFVMI